MEFQIGERRLTVISSLYQGRVNDVHICREAGAGTKDYVTLLVIKDRKTARTVVEMEAGKKGGMPYREAFPWQDQYCLVFDYRSPRPVRDFFVGYQDAGQGKQWERLMFNIVLRCMEESVYSYAFLYLLLEQKQFHIGTDGEVYVNYFLDLEGLDAKTGEARCVSACAGYLADLMKDLGCSSNPELLLRKAERAAYSSFWELYQDVRWIVSPEKKLGILVRIRTWAYQKRELGFRLLAAGSFLLAAVAVVTVASQLVTGDVGWFRLLFHTFERIGTETLG